MYSGSRHIGANRSCIAIKGLSYPFKLDVFGSRLLIKICKPDLGER